MSVGTIAADRVYARMQALIETREGHIEVVDVVGDHYRMSAQELANESEGSRRMLARMTALHGECFGRV